MSRFAFDYAWRSMPLYRLLPAVARAMQVKTYLEIGYWKGGSLDAVLEYDGLEIAVVNDLFTGHFSGETRPERIYDRVRGKSRLMDVITVVGPSQEAVPEFFAGFGPVELTLIDGDHNYETAFMDLTNVVPNSRVTLLHDIDHSSVWDAFQSWLGADGNVDHPFWVTAEAQGTVLIYNAHPVPKRAEVEA